MVITEVTSPTDLDVLPTSRPWLVAAIEAAWAAIIYLLLADLAEIIRPLAGIILLYKLGAWVAVGTNAARRAAPARRRVLISSGLFAGLLVGGLIGFTEALVFVFPAYDAGAYRDWIMMGNRTGFSTGWISPVGTIAMLLILTALGLVLGGLAGGFGSMLYIVIGRKGRAATIPQTNAHVFWKRLALLLAVLLAYLVGKPSIGYLYPPERAMLAEAHYYRGNSYEAEGNLTKAIAEYSEAIALQDGYWKALVNRGSIYYNTGELELALADLDEAIRLNPADWLAYLNRGHVHTAEGNYELALADYSQAQSLAPDLAEPYFFRATLYMLQDHIKLAKDDLYLALERAETAEQRERIQEEIDFLSGK